MIDILTDGSSRYREKYEIFSRDLRMMGQVCCIPSSGLFYDEERRGWNVVTKDGSDKVNDYQNYALLSQRVPHFAEKRFIMCKVCIPFREKNSKQSNSSIS